MLQYDFSTQKQLFEIAYQILEDYNIRYATRNQKGAKR
jgi:hypothetical protein